MPLAATRLAALLLAQQPPARIPIDASSTGDALSYPRLAELQRAVHEARGTLRAASPTLAHGDRVMREGFPRMSGVAFAGNRSLRAWYRDTTVRWVGREGIDGPAADRARVLVEFEPHRVPQFAAVPESVVLLTADVFTQVRQARWADALQLLERADAQVRDTTAARFRANLSGWRANCLLQLGRPGEAQEQAGIAMGRWIDTPNGRLVLAEVKLVRGDPRGAVALLRQHVAIYPHDAGAAQVLAEARRRAGMAR